MNILRQQLIVISVVVGLLAVLVVERAFGLPLLFFFFSFLVMKQSSPALQAVLCILLGLFLSVLYLLPLWLGVLLMAVGFLPMGQWRMLIVTLGLLVVLLWVSGLKLSLSLGGFLLLDGVVFLILFGLRKVFVRTKGIFVSRNS